MSSTFPEFVRSSLCRLPAVLKHVLFFVITGRNTNCAGYQMSTLPKPKNTNIATGFRYSLLLVLAFLSASAVSKTQPYLTDGQCDGYPRAAIDTRSGLCLGLIHQGAPLVKPRRVLEWQPGILLITDMGGWSDHRGTLWRYDVKADVFEPLLSKLNLPHGLTRVDADNILLGEKDALLEVTLTADGHVQSSRTLFRRDIVDGHRHPLMNFVLTGNKTLIVNYGAPTDQCQNQVEQQQCQQRIEDAQLRWYAFNTTAGDWDFDHYQTTYGLRNSMALAVNQYDQVYQADNGMDFKWVFYPLETLNQVLPDQDYGWPYCYPVQQVNPIWAAISLNCAKLSKSKTLLPPHGAPLDMMFYQGQKLAAINNTLLISLHGYQVAGHQLLAVKLNDRQQPLTLADSKYSRDPREQEFGRQQESYPQGYGPDAVEVILRWDELVGVRPKGSPVGLAGSHDGSVWIIEDNNRSLLRLAPGDAFVSQNLWQQDKKVMPPEAVSKVLAVECQACHEQIATGVSERWLNSGLMYQKVVKEKRMPPPGFSNDDNRKLLESWLNTSGQ